MIFRPAICCVLFISALSAQPALDVFQKAPPAVDEALRKRVSEFYQHHVDGTTRKAMLLVAEESQDGFFNAQKSRMKAFEINEVRYGKDFQDATVMTLCDREVAVPLGGVQMMKMPVESSWKLEGGQWMWYIPKATGCKETPFGCVPVDQTEAKSGPAMSAKDLEAKVKSSLAVAQNLGDFGFQTRTVELVAGKTESVELKFANPLDGWVTLQMLNPFVDEEVEVTPQPFQVKPQTEGVVTIRLKKKGGIAKARELSVPFVVQPFFRQSPVRVVLKPRS